MSVAVRLSEEFVDSTKAYAKGHNRSLEKQFEHCVRVCKAAEDNPDLSHEFIESIFIGMDESNEGKVSEYKFGEYADD